MLQHEEKELKKHLQYGIYKLKEIEKIFEEGKKKLEKEYNYIKLPNNKIIRTEASITQVEYAWVEAKEWLKNEPEAFSGNIEMGFGEYMNRQQRDYDFIHIENMK